MLSKENIEIIKVAAVVFGVSVAANVVGSAIYTKSKIGVDKKKMLIGAGVGLGLSFLLAKMLKK